MSVHIEWNPQVFKESMDEILDSMKQPTVQAVRAGTEYCVEKSVDVSLSVIKQVVSTSMPQASASFNSYADTTAGEAKQRTIDRVSPHIEPCVNATIDTSKKLSHQLIDQSDDCSNRSFSLISSIWGYFASYFVRT